MTGSSPRVLLSDVWDQKIRWQIRDCVLFLAIVSHNTQARLECYFRLEWHLAERRTQGLLSNMSLSG